MESGGLKENKRHADRLGTHLGDPNFSVSFPPPRTGRDDEDQKGCDQLGEKCLTNRKGEP